jgi:hypothetical protein
MVPDPPKGEGLPYPVTDPVRPEGMVELMGIEPTTSSMPPTRSPN